jgi:hypothetical protein
VYGRRREPPAVSSSAESTHGAQAQPRDRKHLSKYVSSCLLFAHELRSSAQPPPVVRAFMIQNLHAVRLKDQPSTSTRAEQHVQHAPPNNRRSLTNPLCASLLGSVRALVASARGRSARGCGGHLWRTLVVQLLVTPDQTVCCAARWPRSNCVPCGLLAPVQQWWQGLTRSHDLVARSCLP